MRGGRRSITGQRVQRPLIRIGIVDDHPVFRLGLRRALEREADIEIPWEIGSATELDVVMRRNPVDIVLMDIFLGEGQDGIAATRGITSKWPHVAVAVITASLDERNVLASARAGADMFLSKAMPVAEIVNSIRRLAASRPPRPRTASIHPGSALAADRISGLSRRQRQVLQELRQGHTNREIGKRLGISTATVNKHVHEVLTALHVRNRTQAAGYTFVNGSDV
jgi:two-component system nitrate/nitrite response regulator NarL